MTDSRFLALDIGKRRIGVAVSDPSGMIARPLDTLLVAGDNDAVEQMIELIAAYDVAGIVVGRPLHMSGERSELSDYVDQLIDQLKGRCEVDVYFEDERLTSVQAEAVLHAHGKKIKGNKPKIDRIAAAILLQSFLDRRAQQQD